MLYIGDRRCGMQKKEALRPLRRVVGQVTWSITAGVQQVPGITCLVLLAARCACLVTGPLARAVVVCRLRMPAASPAMCRCCAAETGVPLNALLAPGRMRHVSARKAQYQQRLGRLLWRMMSPCKVAEACKSTRVAAT